VTFVLTDCNYR